MKKFLVAVIGLCALVVATPLLAAKPVPEPSAWDKVAAMLQFMREEEKLAHDVYALFDTIYGKQTNTFSNIAVSEQRHTDAVRALLDKYDVADPAANTAPGEFENDELQALYTDLVNIGKQGLTQALEVGVAIEKKDMTDIVVAIDLSVGYADIVQVYSHLLAGSESHLDGFLKALATVGDD